MPSNAASGVHGACSLPQARRLALNLFCTPTGVGIAHVGGRLNGGNEFERRVHDTAKDDDATRNVVDCVILKAETADQNVDYILVRTYVVPWLRLDLQIPRPKKLNKNEAYLGRYGGT